MTPSNSSAQYGDMDIGERKAREGQNLVQASVLPPSSWVKESRNTHKLSFSRILVEVLMSLLHSPSSEPLKHKDNNESEWTDTTRYSQRQRF